MADVTEIQEREEEAPLLFKTYVLYLDAIFPFRFDICLNGKSQVPEEFYIGSESDEEIVCIPKQELHHLHDDIVSLSLVIRNGWDQRHHPMKAPTEQVAKLNKHTMYMYFASHSRAPFYRHGLGQQPTRDQLIEFLIRENLVANTPSPNHERFLSPNLLPGLVFPYDKVTRSLFIVTPDCMLITLEFQDELVQPDDIKMNYVELLRALHDQVVPADRVRLFSTTSSRSPWTRRS